MKRFTFAAIKHLEGMEDAMIRATMPKTAAADPVKWEEVVRNRPATAGKTLTFKIAALWPNL